MKPKHLMTMACALSAVALAKAEVAACGGVLADIRDCVSSEVSLAFHSKFLTYGLVDNNEPILVPEAALTFFDWVTVGGAIIADVTHYGERAGYTSRAWKHQEVDGIAALSHAFGPDDANWLPTTAEFELGYMFEGHPQYVSRNTQFVTFEVTLPDLWIEPVFAYELDIERDNGTYLNLELGHTFTLICSQALDAADILEFRLSVAQGWGDSKRVSAYLPDLNSWAQGEPSGLEHAGLMDTCIKGEFTWAITDGVKLGAYVAYSDYLLDSTTREAACHYEATGAWEHSWNFVTGCALSVEF